MNIRSFLFCCMTLACLQTKSMFGAATIAQPTAQSALEKIIDFLERNPNHGASYDLLKQFTHYPVSFANMFFIPLTNHPNLLFFLGTRDAIGCAAAIEYLCLLLQEPPSRTNLSKENLIRLLLIQDNNGKYFLEYIKDEKSTREILNAIATIDQQTTNTLYVHSCVYLTTPQPHPQNLHPAPMPTHPSSVPHSTTHQPYTPDPYYTALNALSAALTNKSTPNQTRNVLLQNVQDAKKTFNFERWITDESKKTFNASGDSRNPLFAIVKNNDLDALTFIFSNMQDQKKKNELVLAPDPKNKDRNILYTAALKKNRTFLQAIKSQIDTQTWHQALTAVDTNGGNVLHYAINQMDANMDVVQFIVENCDNATRYTLLTTKNKRNQTVLLLTQARKSQQASQAHTLEAIEQYISHTMHTPNPTTLTASSSQPASPLPSGTKPAKTIGLGKKNKITALHAASVVLCIPALYDWYQWNHKKSKGKKDIQKQNTPDQKESVKRSWYLKDLFASPLKHKKIWISFFAIAGIQWYAHK